MYVSRNCEDVYECNSIGTEGQREMRATVQCKYPGTAKTCTNACQVQAKGQRTGKK